MTQTILLFDMDGVILHSKGYYRGLQAAIKLLGKNLGIINAEVTMDSIAKLEAIGIYHIWDHMATFSALLLIHAWTKNPDIRIQKHITTSPNEFLDIPAVDLSSIIKNLRSDQTYQLHQINQHIQKHYPDLNASQRTYIDFLFKTSQEIYKSPVLPLMQEYALGSKLFSQLYGLPSQLNIQSYPQRYDKAKLTKEHHNQLLAWLKNDNHHAAIFTNRPSYPPVDNFFGTPEAEIGAEIIGLQNLPIIGAGSLEWLAAKNNHPEHSYNKPNPVHALAAMQAALGQPIEQSLNMAVDLATNNNRSSYEKLWQQFAGAKVFAFEDSKNGLQSAQKATQILAQTGIQIDMGLIGIGDQADKKQALLEITDQIFGNINTSPLSTIISTNLNF